MFEFHRSVLIRTAVVFGAMASAVAGTAQDVPETTKPKPPGAAQEAVSFARLAQPDVAKFLELTDSQKAEVARILSERATALAESPDDERAGIAVASEQRLAALLTEPQRVRWNERFARRTDPEQGPPGRPATASSPDPKEGGPSAPDSAGPQTPPAEKPPATEEAQEQPQLSFQFRFQQWEDVLQWLAGEADLSLVLDAPPPGTFNYSDDRKYTPTEAIDLINGVLLTKGYSLIRRGRMLLVVNLKEEIPPGLVPRVSLEELEDRGRFELVSVLFPIEGRVAEEVVAEITPLLGPYGKAVPLAKTKQVLVTDMAGNMRAIHAVIESMPLPKKQEPKPKPKPEPPKKKPEKPVLQVYPIRSADPAAVLQVLEALYAKPSQFVRDPKLDQINAFAVPSVQLLIKQLIDQMESDNPPDKTPRLKVYLLDETQPPGLATGLQQIVPESRVTLDPTGTKLIVWGTPDDQKKIEEILQQLDQGGTADGGRQLEVYQLAKLEPETTVEALRKVVPRARIEIDPETASLIVVATIADHAQIQRAVEALGRGAAPEYARRLALYRLAKPIPDTTLTALKDLMPRAQLQVDAETGDLIAVATPADHEKIRQVLDQLKQSTAPLSTPQLELHPLGKLDPTSTLATLKNLAPRAKLEVDAKTRQLIAVATPSDQETIRKTLTQLSGRVSPEVTPQLEVHRLGKLDATTTVATLKNLVPDAELVPDAKKRQLVAIATSADQEAIRSVLTELQADKPDPSAPQLEFYTLDREPPETLLTLLKSVAPDAQVTVSAGNKQLIVMATETDHGKIQQTIDDFQQHEPAPSKQELRIYSVTPAQQKRFEAVRKAGLDELKEVRVIGESEPGELALWAEPDQHTLIAALLKSLKPQVAADDRYQVLAYTVQSVDPAKVVSVLKELYPPPTKFEADEKSRRLFIWARMSEHAAIRKALEEMDSGPPVPRHLPVVVYPIVGIDPQSIITLLADIVPDAKLTLDSRANAIVATARTEDQEEIRKLIEKMEADTQPASQRQLAVYPCGETDPVQLLSMLDSTLKSAAEIVVNQERKSLLIWAKASQQKAIRTALDQLKQELPDVQEMTAQVYKFRSADPSVVQAVLGTLYPEIATAINTGDDSLVVSAMPKDHAKIKATIQQMDPTLDGQPLAAARSYPITSANPTTVLTMLQQVFVRQRDVQLSLDAENNRIVAVASPANQQAIAALVKDLDSEPSDANTRVLRFYPLSDMAPDNLVKLLQGVAPKAKITVSPSRRQLMVMATVKDHEKIVETIDQFQQHGMVPIQQRLKVYPVTAPQRQRIQAVLGNPPEDLKGIRIITDGQPGELAVWAKPEQHTRIAELLETTKGAATANTQYRLLVHAVRSADPTKLVAMLQSLYPAPARFEMDERNQQLLIWAQATDHPAILASLKQMDSGEAAPRYLPVVVYPITGLNPRSIMQILESIVPSAKLTEDSTAGAIVAEARQSDQDLIRSLIDKMQEDTETVGRRVLSVYPCGETDPALMLTMLDSKLKDEAEIVVNEERRSLLIWAEPKRQRTLRTALDQLSGQLPEKQQWSARVYHFRSADPRTVQSVLATLYPEAKAEVNEGDFSLVVSALPKDMVKIDATIQQIDAPRTTNEAPLAKAYPIGAADPTLVQSMIANVFAQQPEVQVTADTVNNRLIAVATPAQHETIKRLVDELQNETDAGTTLTVYALENADPITVQDVLTTLFAKRPIKPDLSVDETGKQLVAIATPEQHQIIDTAVKQLQVAEREMEVFQLRVVDSEAAEMAIDNLFGTYYGYGGSDSPLVDSDTDTQQLYVRANAKQLDKIRQLLIKMGETSLQTARDGQRRRVRVIPFQGDTEAAVREIEQLWKQLRGGPVRSVTPSAVAPTLRDMGPDGGTPEPAEPKAIPPEIDMPSSSAGGGPEQRETPPPVSSPPPATAEERPPADGPNGPAAATPAAVQPQPAPDPPAAVIPMLTPLASGPRSSDPEPTAAKATAKSLAGMGLIAPGRGNRADSGPAADPAAASGPQEPAANATESTSPPTVTSPPAEPSSAGSPPALVLAPGTGAITIASNDLDALDQIEAVLRSQSRGAVRRDANFQVFPLRNADAQGVAKSLQLLFKGRRVGRGYRSDAASIVADERTNSLVVRAGRADRAAIEDLLQVMDAAEVPTSLSQKKPTRIPLKHRRANEVEVELRDLYSSQLTSPGGRRPLPVPIGLPADMALALEQYNAQIRSPLLTLGVDRTTNSLLVSAPSDLTDEIQKLVIDMDEAAGTNPAQGLKIIPLKKGSAESVQETLQQMIRDSRRYRSYRGSR